jgi:hypothetical protein
MPFNHHPTIDLVFLVVPKSLLVNHLRDGLGTILALSNQHVQTGYLFVFALDYFLKPCMVSLGLVLRAFISTLEQLEQPLLVEALESSVALELALVLSQGYYSLPQDFYVYPSSINNLIEGQYEYTSTVLNINDQTVWSRYMQIWSQNTFL